MKYLLFPLFSIFFSITLNGQVTSLEYGEISAEDISYSEHKTDKEAEAVVLYDIGKSTFIKDDEGGFDIIFERRTRIKILKEGGLEYAEVNIPYYHEGNNYEQVYNVKGSTYNFEDGKLIETKFKNKNLFTEKINSNWDRKKLALPNVKVGSIIEYTYKIQTPYIFNLVDWEFQWRIPNLYSKYEVSLVPFYTYSYIVQGVSKFDHFETKLSSMERQFGPAKYRDMLHVFILKNIDGFKDEEFITSVNDYIIKIDFQLSKVTQMNGAEIEYMSTWPKIAKELEKRVDFGKFIKKSEKAASKIPDIAALEGKTDKEKFESVVNYVKSNYNWNGENRKYAQKSVNELMKDKYGNSAELNLFMIGLLNAVGIESYGVLISTRNHGKVKSDYPFIHFFNYTLGLAYFDGKPQLADATETLTQPFRIPPRCINDNGLLINSDKIGWVDLKFNKPSKMKFSFDIDVVNDSIEGEVELSADEYTALYLRKKYGDDIEKLNTALTKKGYNLVDSCTEIEGLEDINTDYQYKFKVNNPAEKINNKFYISPFLFECISENPLKQDKRHYPLDMHYPKIQSYVTTIKIPENYRIDYKPDNFHVRNNLFEMKYNILENGDELQVTMSYYFKNSEYLQTDYNLIKYYFKEIVKHGNKKIVLAPTDS